MGTTMRQELDAIAGAYENQERHIQALQESFLEFVRDSNGCVADPCNQFKQHPAPWHAEKCGCAEEAREAFIERLSIIDAKAHE